MNQEDFPIIKNQNIIYFDSAATSLKPKYVLDKINYFYNYLGFNSHNHDSNLSFLLNQEISKTRKQVQNFINAQFESEIIFTPSATFGLNQVAFGLRDFVFKNQEIFITKLEHSSNILPWIDLCRAKKTIIKYIPLNKHYLIDLKKFLPLITKKTKIIALNNVSNTFGYLENIKKIIFEAKKINPNLIFVVDGTQSVSCHKIDVLNFDIDFFVFSGHKMMASTGIGVLYGKKHWLKKIKPLLSGGGMWEYDDKDLLLDYNYKQAPAKFEAGSLNSQGIFSLGAALTYLKKIGITKIRNYVFNLRNYCILEMKKHLGSKIIIYNCYQDSSLILFNFKTAHDHDVACWLANKHNILLRAGRLCTKFELDLLKTKGLLRLSFYIYNTKKEVDYFVSILKNETNFIL